MCDGGGGGDGGGDSGQGATGQGVDPGGEFGGSGGNVGMGDPGGGGGATGRGDQGQSGAVGAPGSAMGPGAVGGMGAPPGDTSGIGFDSDAITNNDAIDADFMGINAELDATMNEGAGAFGFGASAGAKGGLAFGSMLAGLPTGLIGALIGGLMGVAEGGDVDAYGGGDPDAGGGPSDPYPYIPLNPKPPGWGEDDGDGGAFFSPGSATGEGGGIGGLVKRPEKLGFSGDSGLSQYKTRKLLEDKDALGEDYTTELKKFTKSLF